MSKLQRSRARELRTNLTEAEQRLWYHIRGRQIGGCKFRRQLPLGRYIVDFVCLEKRVIVELDGGQHAEQESYDDQRSAWLESQGFRVVRFWNHDVMMNIEGVKEEILRRVISPSP